MKQITNFREATVFDSETDGLLNEATLFHVLSFDMVKDNLKSSLKGDNHDGIRRFFQYHIDKGIPIVAHNAISFDIPVTEKLLGIDLSRLMVIDTLYLSWYLNVNRKSHGLGSFNEDYGIAKPVVTDWVGLDQEEREDLLRGSQGPNYKALKKKASDHYKEMKFRCTEDVKINRALWDDFMERLENMATMAMEAINDGSVGGRRMSEEEVTYLDQFVGCTSVDEYIDRTLTFLMMKADMARLRERTKFKLNIPFVEEKVAELSEKIESARTTLEQVMPPVPKYAPRKRPKKPYLKDGKTLSVHGKSWNVQIKQLKDKSTDEFGNRLVLPIEGDGEQLRIYKKSVPPNAGSSSQLKAWLFSHGWIPQTFKFENDEPAVLAWRESGFHGKKPEQRRIPQISKDGDEGKELCQSVILLAEKVPEVLCYSKFTTIKHRLDTMKGFLDHCDEDGYIECRVGGITNTLREKHRNVVNLPGIDKFFGEEIRGSLIADEGKILLGSDLSSLEDRTKHHYMLPHDAEYVETMLADDYDPHILVALSAGLITQIQFELFMKGVKPDEVKQARKGGKATNYASTYGAHPPTIARSAGVPLEVGKKLFDGYWKLNWSIKTIVEEQYVFTCNKGLKWLVNPINGMCYNVRKDSDIFSTLNQGTGSFVFDMWIDAIMTKMYDKWGQVSLSLLMHDEFVISFKDNDKLKADMEKITLDSIDEVNVKYKLRRKMGCDCQFGYNYGQIH